MTTPEQHANLVRATKRAVLSYIADQRWIADPETGRIVRFDHADTMSFCAHMSRNLEVGWCFPTDLGVQIPKEQTWSKLYPQFQVMMLGFKRDLFDNGHFYAGCSPPASHVVEIVGEKGEGFVDIGGLTVPFAENAVKSGEYKFVKAEDIDWDEGLVKGGLGNQYILEE